MKRFLVVLLCGMLMLPTAATSVQAAASTNSDTDAADDVAQDSILFLNKHYDSLGFSEKTESEKKQKDAADKIMGDVAGQLGLKFEKGKLTDDPAQKTGFKTADAVNDYVRAVMEELTACKAAATPPENPDGQEDPELPPVSNSSIIIGGKEYDTTVANAGQDCEIAVPLVNVGKTDVTDVTITPVLGSDAQAWPFEISKTDYSQVWDELPGENSGQSLVERKHTFRWALKTRKDAVTGYTKLTFNVSYLEADGTTRSTVALDYYVQVNGVEPKKEGETGKTSTPRVIVTGFTTDPEEVYAGDTFKLTLNLKNTSKQTAVSNMLFDIQGTQEGTDAQNTYSAFLPTAGSSTIFVDKIGANASKSITIELKSKSDLAQKPYVVTVNMEYEDKDKNAYTETASVSVPIKQEPKVDVSSIQVMPESAEVGSEANVMFSIYNVGKTKLYNVNVKFEADSVSGGDTFVGNMEPGATGNVDAYLSAQAPTMDDGTVKIIITYEDEEGKQTVIEKTMSLFVSEPFFDPSMEDPSMMEIPEEKAGFPWWGYALIAVGGIAVVVTVVVVVKKKKKAKKLAQEELDTIAVAEDNDSL